MLDRLVRFFGQRPAVARTLHLVVCGECRWPHPESARFCRKCGKSLRMHATEMKVYSQEPVRAFAVFGPAGMGPEEVMRASGVPWLYTPYRPGSRLTASKIDVCLKAPTLALVTVGYA